MLAILLFAGGVKGLVIHHRWIMYSLFIGLTLGGIPVVWKMVRPAEFRMWLGAAVGFAAMAAIGLLQGGQGGAGGDSAGMLMMLLAGVAGASAMILPGVSGGYLLLVMGVYVPILSAIDSLKMGLKAGDIDALWQPVIDVVLPVGVGVVIGVLAVSNLLKWVLARYEKATLGSLLGLLAGAVVGLWPFQAGVAPKIGEIFRGQVVSAESLATLKPEKFPTEFFSPDMMQIIGAVVLIAIGFAATTAVARFGSGAKKSATKAAA